MWQYIDNVYTRCENITYKIYNKESVEINRMISELTEARIPEQPIQTHFGTVFFQVYHTLVPLHTKL